MIEMTTFPGILMFIFNYSVFNFNFCTLVTGDDKYSECDKVLSVLYFDMLQYVVIFHATVCTERKKKIEKCISVLPPRIAHM